MDILNKIIKTSIYLLVFLVPIFFLPFSFEAFEFNKQYLLFFLVSLALFVWLAKMVLIDKEIRFRRTPLDLPVLGFLAIAVLSAIFSVDKISSWFGFYGRFSNGLLGLLCLGALYFLITNNVGLRRSVTVNGLLKVFLYSIFFVVLFSYFSIFGLWTKFQLPQLMLQSTFNPLAGSMEALAVFLSIAAVLLVGMILLRTRNVKGKLEGAKGLVFYFLLLASLGLLVIIDFVAAWLVMIMSLTLFMVFVLWKRIFRENVNKLLVPIFLIIIAGIGISTDFQNSKILPQEQVLSQSTSWKVAAGAVTENVKAAFLGSGIGTFHYDFAKFKPAEFNQTRLWQIRFDRSGSHISELLATTGILGILSYLVLAGMFLLVSWFLLQVSSSKSKIQENWLFMPLLMTFVALLTAQFVYYQNTVLLFVFWLVLGLTVVLWQKPVKEKVFSFKELPELSLVFSVILLLLGLGIAGFYYQTAKFYRADVAYNKTNQLAFQSEQAEQFKQLEKAVRLNPFQPQYKLILARVYLNRLLSESAKPLNERDQNIISESAYYAISYVKGGDLPLETGQERSFLAALTGSQSKRVFNGAAELAPNQVAVYETMGMIYRDVQGMAQGATDWAVKSFEKAVALEPTNPVLHTELGKLYAAAFPETEKAQVEFEKAIELKSDYIDAHLQLTFLQEQKGDLAGAVQNVQGLVNNFPYNIEIRFQLGRLYFNDNKTDEAIEQFQTVVAILPTHSNALYSLGVAYQAKGEKETALQYFKKVLELNPDNADIQKKIEELK